MAYKILVGSARLRSRTAAHRTEGHVMNIDDMNLSPELREKAKACKTPEEMLALAKKEGYKLSEEELAAVSGGGGWSKNDDNFCNPWT